MTSRKILSKEGKLGGEEFLKGTRIRVSDIKTKYNELDYEIKDIEKAYPRLTTKEIKKAIEHGKNE